MIAFLGPVGTFTESAAKVAFPTATKDALCALSSVPAILDSVASGTTDAGIVPVENSIQGTVHMTIDGLLTHPGLEIIKEVLLKIEQHLMVCPGTLLEHVSEAWSHPQALAQCRGFIHTHHLREVQFDSTAGAAQALAQSNRKDVCVIGPLQAASEHGLQVLEENIADVRENWTRFAVIARVTEEQGGVEDAVDMPRSNPKKSMMVVTPSQNFPGVLASILNVFSTLGLNLCWIESRPTRQRLGTYQFFVEVQTGIEDAALVRALNVLRAYGHHVRVFGSYEAAFPTEPQQP